MPHNVTVKTWAHFSKMAETNKCSRALNQIASKSGLKSASTEMETFSTRNDVLLTQKSQNVYISDNLPL